ncbi:MAG: Tom37 metaxin N-terminal-like domain-containing protein, partial [Pseudomonadota bacterium]
MKLLVYPPAFGELNGSPFCVKALALLQMSGLDFETEIIDDPRKQPKGKLPVLHDEGTVIPDSSLIRVHLEQKYGLDFDAGLDPRQKAESHAIVRMLEEGLYFLIVAS